MPCQHNIVACAHVRVYHRSYVSLVYKLQNVFNVYNHSFRILPDESLWSENHEHGCCHDPDNQINPRGRSTTSRIHTEIDMRERGQPKRCSMC